MSYLVISKGRKQEDNRRTGNHRGVWVIPYRTKFSSDKIFRRTKFPTPGRNFNDFVRFLPDFCIKILDKIFDGQNFSSDRIFETKPKFRQFCPIRYANMGEKTTVDFKNKHKTIITSICLTE